MKDKKKIWDFEGVKSSEWIIGFAIAFILIMPVTIIFQLYSRISTALYGGIIVAVMICNLIVTILKERREKCSSDYQKFTIGIVIFMIILNIIAIIMFIVSPPPLGKAQIALAEIEDEYYSLSYYYAKDFEQIETTLLKMQENIVNKKYEKALDNIEEYDHLKTNTSSIFISLCRKAEEKGVILSKNKNLADLDVYCRSQELSKICQREEISALNSTVDLLQNMKKKTKADCLEVIKKLNGSKECREFNRQLSQEEPGDFSDLESVCKLLS